MSNSQTNFPQISCLMVTGNRKKLAERSIWCFCNQSWGNKELVIIDDGDENLNDIIPLEFKNVIKYYRIEKSEKNNLGYLRNLSLEKANGDFIAQWDDDDWYHRDRLRVQAECLLNGFDACTFEGTLMHLDNKEFFKLPYVGFLPNGVPGSIMHIKNNFIRYPEIKRAEDTYYLDQWRKKKYKILGREHSDKFIRCFHGSNTWESEHFERRIRNNIVDATIWYFLVIFKMERMHRRFKLQKHEKEAFNTYLNESKKFNLL